MLQYFGMLSGTPSFDLEFDLEDDLEHKNKGHIVFSVPNLTLNPRPAGIWLVTRPAGGGGGGQSPLPEISQTTGPISKI